MCSGLDRVLQVLGIFTGFFTRDNMTLPGHLLPNNTVGLDALIFLRNYLIDPPWGLFNVNVWVGCLNFIFCGCIRWITQRKCVGWMPEISGRAAGTWQATTDLGWTIQILPNQAILDQLYDLKTTYTTGSRAINIISIITYR